MTHTEFTEDIVADFQYLANDDNLAVYIASVGGGEVAPHEGNYISREMQVINGRNMLDAFDLDRQGFRLESHQSQVTDFYDDEQIAQIYENEICTMIQSMTGASRVEVFDHTRRAASERVRLQKKIREPASVIHNDYTTKSGPKRLRDLYPNEADAFLSGRIAIINIWRSINGTVKNHPLCLCDATTVEPEDLVSVTRQAKDRMGEIQLAIHNPAHRWFYFPEMTEQEALVFKTYDSSTDGRTRFPIHTSFDDPAAPADAPSRESLETRCFVIF